MFSPGSFQDFVEAAELEFDFKVFCSHLVLDGCTGLLIPERFQERFLTGWFSELAFCSQSLLFQNPQSFAMGSSGQIPLSYPAHPLAGRTFLFGARWGSCQSHPPHLAALPTKICTLGG